MQIRPILLSAALALSSTALLAAPFEGVVTYKLLRDDASTIQTMDFSIKGDRYRVDMSASGHQSVMIMNTKAKEFISLMPERKSYMVTKMDGKAASPAKKAGKLVKTGKTATIAGYKAEEWTYEGAEHTTSIWGNKDLGGWAFSNPQSRGPQIDIPAAFKDGGFFPLRVVGDKGNGIEAVKVEKKSVDSSLFDVPAGYTKMDAGAAGGMSGMSAAQKQMMEEKMQHMTPEQRAMIEKMMQGQGAAGASK